MSEYTLQAQFSPGMICSLPEAARKIPMEERIKALQRHLLCDWGDVSEQDRRANNAALLNGSRIISCYQTKDGTRFWILTEADRSVTTVLLPQEY